MFIPAILARDFRDLKQKILATLCTHSAQNRINIRGFRRHFCPSHYITSHSLNISYRFEKWYSLLPVLLLQAASVSAACSRQSLLTARDDFFKAGAAKNTAAIKLAANSKIALNNKITPLASTPFTNLTGFTNLKVEAVDTDACQIATFRVSDSQVLSTRLKVDAAGTISEVEFLQAVKGDQFFRPAGFPATTPTLWSGKQIVGPPPNIPATWTPIGGTPKNGVNKANCKTGAGPARLLNRRELMYVAATYADGLKGEPWGSCVIGGKSCPRNENGVTTTPNCAVGTGVFNFLTRGRRWVVDTEKAVVLGAFLFRLRWNSAIRPKCRSRCKG